MCIHGRVSAPSGFSSCTSKHGMYRCPRCNAPYCSAACYKQHGESCTESFYRESATQQLRATRATPADKQHMMEVLQRLHLQEQQQQQLGGDPLGLGLPSDHPSTSSGSRGFAHSAAPAGGAEWEEGDEEEDEVEEDEEQQRAWLAAEAAKLGISADLLTQILDQAEQEGEDWEPPEDLLPPAARAALLIAARQTPEAPPTTPQQQQQPSSSQASGRQRAAAGKTQALGANTPGQSPPSQQAPGVEEQPAPTGSSEPTPSTCNGNSSRTSSSNRKEPGSATSSSSGDREAWQPWWTTAAAAELQLGPSGLPLVQEVQVSSTAGGTANGLTQLNGAASSSSSGGQGEAAAGRDPPLPPAPTSPIPSLSALTKVPPSPLLAWQLLQLLFSYCLLYCQVQGQLLVGDWSNLQRLLVLAPHLLPPGGGPSTTTSSSSSSSNGGGSGGGAAATGTRKQPSSAAAAAAARQQGDMEDAHDPLPVPESAAMALAQVMAACHSPLANLPGATSQRQQTALAAVADAGVVLQLGRSCVLLALHQLLSWVDRDREAVKALQQQQKRQATAAAPEGANSNTAAAAAQRVATVTLPSGAAGIAAAQLSPGAVKLLSSQLKAAGRKLRYLLAWANEAPEQLYQQLAVAAATEHQQLQGSHQPIVTGVVLPGANSGTNHGLGGTSVPGSSTSEARPPVVAAAAAAARPTNRSLVVPLDSGNGGEANGGTEDASLELGSTAPSRSAAAALQQQATAASPPAAPPAAAAPPPLAATAAAVLAIASVVGEAPPAQGSAAALQAAAPLYAAYVEDLDALD